MTAPEVFDLVLPVMGGFVLFATVLAGLLQCFLGYPLLRLWLVLFWMGAGIVGGVLLAGVLRAGHPSPADRLIAGGGLALIGGLVGWYLGWALCRVVMALLLAASIFAVAIALRLKPVWTGAAAVSGLLAGVLTFIFTRPLVMVFTALGGASDVVSCLALAALGQQRYADIMLAPGANLGAAAVLAAATLALAAVGFWVQLRLTRRFHNSLQPAARAKPARGSAS